MLDCEVLLRLCYDVRLEMYFSSISNFFLFYEILVFDKVPAHPCMIYDAIRSTRRSRSFGQGRGSLVVFRVAYGKVCQLRQLVQAKGNGWNGPTWAGGSRGEVSTLATRANQKATTSLAIQDGHAYRTALSHNHDGYGHKECPRGIIQPCTINHTKLSTRRGDSVQRATIPSG